MNKIPTVADLIFKYHRFGKVALHCFENGYTTSVIYWKSSRRNRNPITKTHPYEIAVLDENGNVCYPGMIDDVIYAKKKGINDVLRQIGELPPDALFNKCLEIDKIGG